MDIEASAEKFIRRMTNKCTYLVGEDVLPKDSLLYRKFMVLNELNNLCLNGDHISVQLKQDIYENVFCKKRKVTIKKLKDYLKCCGYDVKSLEISGIDGDFKTQLTSYHDFKEKLTGVTLSPKDKEEIILNIVLFGEDQKLLKQRLRQLFPQLTEKQLKSISLLRYKGWGKLSKTFLEEIKSPVPGCSEEKNIISALWESEFEEDTDKYCPNLNQLLSNQYEFKKKIEDFNCKDEKVKLTYETVSNLHLSPAVKRPIWQTLKVIKEIQKVMGKAPKRVFIEMGRGNEGKKQRTLSRKSQLVNLYTACKKEVKSDEWVQEVFGRLEHEDDYQLRSKKLYLYYLQMGRCMYSQEVIPFEELWDKNKYDIDHIFPQSKTMDDSLDNLVLVKSGLNRDKSDDYPIKIEIQTARMSFWKMLKEKNFISKKKYERLVRTTKLTPDELAYFIERQLVETRQSTKAVATILKQALPSQTKVIYVKAGTVSRFRQDFDLIKVREMNDLHHAKDAYLNIVVGNSYYVKFTESASWFVRNHPRRSYNLKEMFKSDKHKVSDIVSATNGEVAWRAGKNGTIATVENIMKKNNILVTNKTYEAKGELFKAQPLKKGKGQFPLKTTDLRLANIEKYGGYNKVTGSYFVLVQSKDKKGKIKKTIEFVPIYLKELFEKNEEERIRYLTINCELMEPKILLKIKMNTLLVMNGFKMRITARQGNNIVLNNANQLILSSNEEKILKKVLKYIDRKSKNSKLKITQEDKIIESDLVLLYETFLVKIIDTVYYVKLKNSYIKLCDLKENFEKATLEDKCIAIREILHLFQCDATKPNLSVIKGSGSGRITISKTMANLDNLIMVTQSITGIFEKEIDLLAL